MALQGSNRKRAKQSGQALLNQTNQIVNQESEAALNQAQQNTAALQQEYTNYKIGLRNKIASNIDFTAVVGDGSCVVSFKLDASGNLINRAFSQQSINDSLNDAVYSAMMNTPTYKTPPAGYKNQTLRLSVKMTGGNFEVNLY